MGDRIFKAQVTLSGVMISGHSSIAWKFQTGVAPYTTIMSCVNVDWNLRLKNQIGAGLTLLIVDSQGTKTEILDVFILHKVASTKPSVTTFLVADRRWKWNRILIARAYNISRRTGDTNTFNINLPEGQVTTNAYDYKPYSLQNGDTVWTAREAFEDALGQLEDKDHIRLTEFSATDEFSLQNVILRDQGDVALARLMAFIPGTNVWVDKKGKVQVINTFDLDAGEAHRKQLPPATWDGDKSEMIDRRKIRPRQVNVYYEREVEAVLTYSDDLRTGATTTPPGRNELFIENVIATTDPETIVFEYDPETNKTVTKTVGPGTYVEVGAWFAAMDKVKPDGSAPWNFKAIKTLWVTGGLDGVWMSTELRGTGLTDTTNVLNAIQSLKQNFRQTFRISRRYMQRLQSIEAVRVTLLDPITGTRMPSTVWGQVALLPNDKGQKTISRNNPDSAGWWYNIDTLPNEGERLIDKAPGPQTVNFLDRDAGIFRLETLVNPYGTIAELIPCNIVDAQGALNVPTYNLRMQDTKSVCAGMRLQNGTNKVFLSDTLEFKAMVTIVPGAPNSKAAFHVEVVDTTELADKFEGGKFRIQDGEGPILEVFIPASEVTARFGWDDDTLAEDTIEKLIGLNDDDPTKGGLIDDPNTPKNEAIDLPGFKFVNHNREVFEHARAVAAEMVQSFADSLHGRVTTVVPKGGEMILKGNMSGATIQVASAPSAKVVAVHEFPGQSQPVSRFALLPKSVRLITLGIVRLK